MRKNNDDVSMNFCLSEGGDMVPATLDPIESIEELLRRCGFFDNVIPWDDDEKLPN